MPYPTAEIGDPVTYINNAGTLVPALAATADGGSHTISLFVDDPAGAYFVHVVPQDLTSTRANSWNWPVNVSGGDVTLTAFGSTPNANGASLAGQALTLQPADGTHPGGVSTSAQTFAGVKTFSSSLQSASGYGNTGAGSAQGLSFSGDDAVVRGTTTYLQTLNGGATYAHLGGTGGNTMLSSVTDGASAVAQLFDTSNALSTSGAKLVSWQNHASEKAYVDLNGAVSANNYTFTAGTVFNVLPSGSNLLVSLPTAGNLQVQSGNTGAHFAIINSNGVEVDVVGQGFILKSPDGTRYKITVANGGALSTTPA